VAQQGQTNHSFLAACAEYCPVNELLPDYNWPDDVVTKRSLERLQRDCKQLVDKFDDIAFKCFEAYSQFSRNDRSSIQNIVQVYNEIRGTVHIFGLKPECNDQLRPTA
jgi:hypothetical protein